MRIACITACIGVAAFAASLQVGAQPPEGKGKPEHPGASAFIRFPVPQRAVGVRGASADAKAARPVKVALEIPAGGFAAAEKKAAAPECVAR